MSWPIQPSPWPARDDELRALFAEGLTEVQAAERMGLSKNQVCGRRKRIGIELLGIRAKRNRGDAPLSAKVLRRTGRVTLPVLMQKTVAEVAVEPVNPVVEPVIVPVPEVAVPPEVVAPVPALRLVSSGKPCCWPIGEPGTPEFHFCDGDAVQGRPYCPEHCEVAYLKPAAAREQARALDWNRWFAPRPGVTRHA